MSRRFDDAGQIIDLLYDILETLQNIAAALKKEEPAAPAAESDVAELWVEADDKWHRLGPVISSEACGAGPESLSRDKAVQSLEIVMPYPYLRKPSIDSLIGERNWRLVMKHQDDPRWQFRGTVSTSYVSAGPGQVAQWHLSIRINEDALLVYASHARKEATEHWLDRLRKLAHDRGVDLEDDI
jgi:hypothetical protein